MDTLAGAGVSVVPPASRGAPAARPVGDGEGSPSPASRLERFLSAHFAASAGVLTAFMALAAWHLYVPADLVTANGHLVDPSTTAVHGYNVWSYRSLSYSDIYRLYAERGLWGHPLPYFTARIEYPVLTGVFMWLASFAPGVQGDFVASAIGLWVAALVTLYALRKVRPRTYHWFALTPLLFVFSLLNWDLLGICALAVGWWMAEERRYGAAGVALALGTCAKLFPAVYVPFLLASLVREQGWRATATKRFAGAVVATIVVVNLPFAAGAWHNWTFFLSFNATRGGSGVLPVLAGHVAAEDALIGLLVLAAAALGVRSVLRGGSVERAAVLTFVVFLLLNKVYSPQYTLWLVVMAILAEWPGWAVVLLSVVGLADYYGQFATLYATNASVGHGTLTAWWERTVSPWVSRVRYAGLAICALGGGFA